MIILLYGYKKCTTCRKAEQHLQQHKLAYEFIDITENPPNAVQLARIATLANVLPQKMFNTSGEQYRQLNIKQLLPTLTHQEMLNLLEMNGRLIKRPLLTDGKRATVGFNAEQFLETWK
jgi:arsenate reductase